MTLNCDIEHLADTKIMLIFQEIRRAPEPITPQKGGRKKKEEEPEDVWKW